MKKLLLIPALLVLSEASAQYMPIPPYLDGTVIEALYTEAAHRCESDGFLLSNEWHACMATELWWLSDITWLGHLNWDETFIQCQQVQAGCGDYGTYADLYYDASYWFADWALYHWEQSLN